VTRDATACRPGLAQARNRWRPGLTPAANVGCPGLAPAANVGCPGLAPAGSETPVCGVDWVTMSDSCHTERRRIGDTPEKPAERGRPSS
jgi:hypothetical protein